MADYTEQNSDDADGIDADNAEVDITLPYRVAEAALILLDVSIDQSDIDPAELEQQRLQLVHILREALGSDADYEAATDDASGVGGESGADGTDAAADGQDAGPDDAQ